MQAIVLKPALSGPQRLWWAPFAPPHQLRGSKAPQQHIIKQRKNGTQTARKRRASSPSHEVIGGEKSKRGGSRCARPVTMCVLHLGCCAVGLSASATKDPIVILASLLAGVRPPPAAAQEDQAVSILHLQTGVADWPLALPPPLFFFPRRCTLQSHPNDPAIEPAIRAFERACDPSLQLKDSLLHS